MTAGPMAESTGPGADTVNDLMPLVYDQLRDLAAAYLRRDAAEPMLEPALLVNEAYLRLAANPAGSWNSKEHFLAVAAIAMRKILIDQARRRHALKRGFGRSKVSLDLVTSSGPREIDILDVDDALKAFDRINSRACQRRCSVPHFLSSHVNRLCIADPFTFAAFTTASTGSLPRWR